MYFNYYATQSCTTTKAKAGTLGTRPYGTGWWPRNRAAATSNGSWYFHDEHGKSGGRLYHTAMCVMILEVYYRHMPLYGKRAVEEDL